MTRNSAHPPVYAGRLIDLAVEPVALPGGRSVELEIVRHPGGAVIVAVNAAGEVCLLKQYRYAVGGAIWELPAGTIDRGERADQTAHRELREEAGVTAARWTDLGVMYSTPGFCDERLFLYLARDLAKADTEHGVDEVIEVHWIGFTEALNMARGGTIRDGKTIVALFRALNHLSG